MNQSHKLLVCHIQELVEVNATKCELAKSPLFLKNSSLFCCLIVDGGKGRNDYNYTRAIYTKHTITIEVILMQWCMMLQ